ncbi:MAG: trigger factor [Oscillospiraceae bacterium]|nr:trigger factor [Oscillospiraceae bacterium]
MSLKTTNKIDANTYELEIEISAEKFEEALQKAYLKSKSKIDEPGFRKGKAPRKVIEKTYGENCFYEDAVNLLYGEAVGGAVEEANLELVCQPEVEVTACDKENGVAMKAKCTTKPEVAVKDYKGVEAEKSVREITEDEINAEVDKLRQKGMRIINVDDRAAQMGDDVVIDFEGFKDNVAFDGGKAEKFTLSLGSGQFIPGFEEQVAGHSIGEEFDINVSFPEDYGVEDLKGAPVVFKIKLHEIKAKELPELDDEFVKDTTEFDTVDDLKADIKKRLEDAAEKTAQNNFEGAVFDKVVENMEAEIPEVMYERRVAEMIQDLEQRLAPQGISLEMYMQFTNQTIESIQTTYREQAEKQVKLRLALEKIAEVEKLEVSDEDVEAEITRMSEMYGMEVAKIKELITNEDVKKDLLVAKAADFVKDSAVVK